MLCLFSLGKVCFWRYFLSPRRYLLICHFVAMVSCLTVMALSVWLGWLAVSAPGEVRRQWLGLQTGFWEHGGCCLLLGTILVTREEHFHRSVRQIMSPLQPWHMSAVSTPSVGASPPPLTLYTAECQHKWWLLAGRRWWRRWRGGRRMWQLAARTPFVRLSQALNFLENCQHYISAAILSFTVNKF